MRESWTEWANRELGRDGHTFRRGRPKAKTRAEHLSPEDYRRSLEIAAERERDGPWREFVQRVAELFGDDRNRKLVDWLHRQREARLREPRDPDQMAADLAFLADCELEEHELQAFIREIEAQLERERREPRQPPDRSGLGGFER